MFDENELELFFRLRKAVCVSEEVILKLTNLPTDNHQPYQPYQYRHAVCRVIIRA